MPGNYKSLGQALEAQYRLRPVVGALEALIYSWICMRELHLKSKIEGLPASHYKINPSFKN